MAVNHVSGAYAYLPFNPFGSNEAQHANPLIELASSLAAKSAEINQLESGMDFGVQVRELLTGSGPASMYSDVRPVSIGA